MTILSPSDDASSTSLFRTSFRTSDMPANSILWPFTCHQGTSSHIKPLYLKPYLVEHPSMKSIYSLLLKPLTQHVKIPGLELLDRLKFRGKIKEFWYLRTLNALRINTAINCPLCGLPLSRKHLFVDICPNLPRINVTPNAPQPILEFALWKAFNLKLFDSNKKLDPTTLSIKAQNMYDYELVRWRTLYE